MKQASTLRSLATNLVLLLAVFHNPFVFAQADKDPPPFSWSSARRTIAASITRPDLDVKTVVRRLNRDPKQIESFIQKNIRVEPYSGRLRNASQVLFLRAGNSIDRAGLLGELLKQAGYTVRYKKHIARTEIPTAGLTPKADSELIDTVRENALLHLAAIGDALYSAGALAQARQAGPADATNPSEHYVVEFKKMDEWIAADPMGQQRPDEHLSDGQVTDVLPGAFPQVTFSFLVALQGQEKPVLKEVLNHTASVADLAFRPIVFQHQHSNARLTPQLLIGNTTIRGQPFAAPFEDAPSGAQAGRRGFGIFDSLPSNASSPRPAGRREEVTGIWARISITGGEQPQTHAFNLRAGLLGDDSASPLTQEGARTLFGAIHGITVLTGTPDGQGIAKMLAEIQDPFAVRGVGSLITSTHLLYEVLRSKVPPIDDPVRRVVSGPSIIVSSLATRAGNTRQLVNLAHTEYQLTLKGQSASFIDHVYAGVVDHMVERVISAGSGRTVVDFFETALQQGVPLRVVQKKGEPVPSYLSSASLALIETALARDAVIVLPASAPSGVSAEEVGWWEIDSRGYTKDTSQFGFHSAAADDATARASAAARTERLRTFACTMAIVAGSTGQLIGHTLTMIGDPAGVPMVVAGQGLQSLGQLGCRWSPRVPPARSAAPIPRPPHSTGGTGFPPIAREISKQPWRYGGRTFPPR